jgi:hypothetical protein
MGAVIGAVSLRVAIPKYLPLFVERNGIKTRGCPSAAMGLMRSPYFRRAVFGSPRRYLVKSGVTYSKAVRFVTTHPNAKRAEGLHGTELGNWS